MKKMTTKKKNKLIFASTVLGLLIISIIAAFSVDGNFQSFIDWSSHGTGLVTWIIIAAGAVYGGLYLIWKKIQNI